MADGIARGTVRAGFERVREVFEAGAADRPGVNLALAVRLKGEQVVDLRAGPGYGPDSLQGVYSVTKGAAGVVLALLVQRGLIDPDEPVATYWPEFAAEGKDRLPVRWLASHQAGLVNVDGMFTVDELLAHEPLAGRLAAQRPFWEPGTAHGYHALTLGALLDELVRRVTGRTLGAYFRDEIARPYGIDFFIGLPESEEERVVPTRPIALGTGDPPFEPPPFFRQAMNRRPGSPGGDLLGMRAFRAAGVPSIGGFGSARGVAALYSTVAHGSLLTPETLARVTAVQAEGPDLVLPMPTRYATVFEKAAPWRPWTGPNAFGHTGAVGALGFADPDLGLGFGFVTDTPADGGPDPLPNDLAAALAP
ncbi:MULTISPECIES: serine hydrolase domain-containing protein [Actinomadura]|uniref:Serine hydrolase domain-containing protein n=1 Tax=Actinomadura yumaensis TaxID=111807 RepID=A0ABW2CZB3_9ACTN|nr:serine hydrolase domain-containing protein [Actinomadura sp. J1-007]MWK35522.1 serine hydrolase [Actinomadura sp. J1-007]